MVRQVLLVEADPSTSARLLGALHALGYRPRAVPSGPLALELARKRRPAAVLVGGAVLDETPARVCQELKLGPVTNRLALVRAASPDAPSDLDIEPDAYLSPPYSPDDLIASLTRALDAADDRRRDRVQAEVRWRLSSHAPALDLFHDQFRGWMQTSGLTGFQMQQLGLAVRELASNAMEWGHRFDRRQLVSVSARLDDEKVTVLVRDGGSGFDPRNLPHAARHGDPITHLQVRAARQLRDGGFGILMASGLLDHLVYNDVGNEALAVKYLPRHSRIVSPRRRATVSGTAGS